MVGLKNSRSVQDEKLIESIFQTHLSPDTAYAPTLDSPRSPPPPSSVYGATCTNLIIDARPTTNALANTAKGAGTENMENYKGGKKAYLGIDNIHVMRDSLSRVVEALRDSEPAGGSSGGVATLPLDRQALRRSGWLKHTTTILEGTNIIVRNVHVNSSHVLIHCSDGWDRTAQLSAVAQLCLDPFYRTIKGFQVLIEKDWLSFGHKFQDRCGHLSSDKFFTQVDPQTGEASAASSSTGGAAHAFFASVHKQFAGNPHLKETSPVFHQFLDCVRQIQRQFPDRFEFNELFLRTLHTHLYSCQFGTFLFNSERDRRIPEMGPRSAKSPFERTVSLWDWTNSSAQRTKWINETYDPSLDDRTSRAAGADMGVLFPNPKDVKFWSELFGRGDEEMNGRIIAAVTEDLPTPPEAGEDDPVVAAVVEESQALDSGRSTPTPTVSASSLGEAAAIPYQARSRGTPSASNGPISASSSQPIHPAHRALEAQDTFRPYSSRTSAFSLQPTPADDDSVGPTPPSSQSSFPAARFSSSPSTINPPSSRRSGVTSSQSETASTSSWGWSQFSSSAISALSGAAKEIGSRVASTSSGTGSVGGGGGGNRSRSALSEQPLNESWGSSSRGGGGGGSGGGGIGRLSLARGPSESNPWAQEDEPTVPSVTSPSQSRTIPSSSSSVRRGPTDEGGEMSESSRPVLGETASSWTVIPASTFGGRGDSSSSPSIDHQQQRLESSPLRPSPLQASSTKPTSSTSTSGWRGGSANPLGGRAEDWSSSAPSSRQPRTFASPNRAPTSLPPVLPAQSTSSSSSMHTSLSDLTINDPSISHPHPPHPYPRPSASNASSLTSSLAKAAASTKEPSPSPSMSSSRSPSEKMAKQDAGGGGRGGGFDPLGVGML